MHEQNCFITLTYNDQNIPKNKSITKRELQLFLKRFRYHINKKIRYFAVGEYGTKLSRPHYHALIFGYDFPDKEIHHYEHPKKKNKFSTAPGYLVYTSETLTYLWSKGFHQISQITFESAGYCARYTQKKIGGQKAKKHYNGKEPEFAIMSLKPGIGADWLKKYFNDVYPKDFVTHKGKYHKPPRYYDKLLERRNYGLYAQIKEERRERAEKPDIIRRKQKDKYRREITKVLEREYENA